MGEGPEGLLIYTDTGQMSGQIMRRGRSWFAAGTLAQGTDAEVREALAGYIAYFGDYVVHEAASTVTHHVRGSWYPNFVGTEQLRHYEFVGDDRLVLRTPRRTHGLERRTGELVWERVR